MTNVIYDFTSEFCKVLRSTHHVDNHIVTEVRDFEQRMLAIARSNQQKMAPVKKTIGGLQYLNLIIANVASESDSELVDLVRSVTGFTPWDTSYVRNTWSALFMGRFACGKLIGPAGVIADHRVLLRLFP